MSQTASKTTEDILAEDIGAMYADPLAFIRYAFPWGEKGTPLAEYDGPDTWQRDVAVDMGNELKRKVGMDDAPATQIAVASGHGVGKSTFIAWIILWFISTRPDCQIVVTANTESQLSGTTWRELAKWHELAINSHWFTWTATRLFAKSRPKTWAARAVPWSKHNAQAFAGVHEKEVLLLFDEASNIDDIIWETAQGALTTPGAVWLAFGNPTRNTGRFRECFGNEKHRWITKQVDSRTAKMASKTQLQQWVEDYGEDSDFVRIRVKGQFPRVGDTQLIGNALVDAANARELLPASYMHYPRFLGVDVARFGSDSSVIIRRQGTMTWTPKVFNRIDTMELAARVYDDAMEFGATVIFVDGVGVGGGVVDRLRELGLNVIDVQSGEAATDNKRFKNRRMELWWRMKEWLDGEVSLPHFSALTNELVAPEYGYDGSLRLVLESVDSLKQRGVGSPDHASALAMTFADFSLTSRSKKARQVRQVRWR